MREKLNLALSLALATFVVFGGLYLFWPQTPISDYLGRLSSEIAAPFVRAPDLVPPVKPIERPSTQATSIQAPEAPVSESVTASACPPGQVAGHFESERTGTRIICHTPSFEVASRPVVTQSAPARTVPVYPQTSRQDVQHSSRQNCTWLSERVKYLDALARQPQSGQMQDWIRSERMDVRDKQRKLRC